MGDRMERMAIGALRWKSPLSATDSGTDCAEALLDKEGFCEGVPGSGGCIGCERVGWMSGICITVLALSTPMASTIPYCV